MAHLLNSSVFLAVLMIALTSVALVPVMDQYGGYTGFLSLSLLGLVGVATVYFVANLRLLPRPRTLRQVLALIFYFPLLLTLSMGLSFHNSVAVIEGLLGIKSSFVRTPKFNIVGQQRGKTDRRQRNPIGKSLIIEGLLTLLFASALVIAVSLQSYGFFIFHLMLAIGFGAIFVASWRER
jgi:hypothetical protein